jgi:NAD(P)-dependent dehydrogenase (short-subunit alcohol dehydrogenase family)
LYTAQLLATLNPLNRLIMVGRTPEKVTAARRCVLQTQREKLGSDVFGLSCASTNPEHGSKGYVVENGDESNDETSDDCTDDELTSNVLGMVCDHTSLESVRMFVSELRNVLDTTYDQHKWVYNGIDVLCLNAAILMPSNVDPQLTEDGFETTFQTNYLSSFLMTNLLQQDHLLNPSAKVIITSSGLYCLSSPLSLDGMLCHDKVNDNQLRRHFATIDGSPYNPKDCYTLSKVAGVAFCAELNRRLHNRDSQQNQEITSGSAICFSPGLMTATGIFRHQPSLANSQNDNAHQVSVFQKEKSISWGAGALVFLILTNNIEGGKYWSDPTSTDCLVESYGRDFVPQSIMESVVPVKQQQLLWEMSCQLLGISSQLF